MFIRENANVKDCPNRTAGKFCQWVNEDVLINKARGAEIMPGIIWKLCWFLDDSPE